MGHQSPGDLASGERSAPEVREATARGAASSRSLTVPLVHSEHVTQGKSGHVVRRLDAVLDLESKRLSK
jgi:hypothetical protein